MTIEEHIEGLKGIKPFLQKKMIEINYEGLGELDAKEIGETIDTAIEALEAVGKSDKLKKPRWNHLYELWQCECGGYVDSEFGYCPYCGSELDWEEA